MKLHMCPHAPVWTEETKQVPIQQTQAPFKNKATFGGRYDSRAALLTAATCAVFVDQRQQALIQPSDVSRELSLQGHLEIKFHPLLILRLPQPLTRLLCSAA